MQKKLLALLTKDPRMPAKTLAKVLGTTEAKVEAEIAKLLKSGEIVGFKTILNSNKNNDSEVNAIVEVKAELTRGRGFDELAERISRFPEVINLYLISGSHDLNLAVRGRSLQEVAGFVNQKLAVLEGVRSTTTHFLLKKYKEDGQIFGTPKIDRRIKVSG